MILCHILLITMTERRWKTNVDLLLDEQGRRLAREREEREAARGPHLDTDSIETAQQAAQVASSALRFISGILGRGSR